MSEDTAKKPPEKGRKKTHTDWTAFDLDLIVCAKHQYVANVYFLCDIPLDDSEERHAGITGTVMIVDKYFVKFAYPASDGTQREVWIPKANMGAVYPNKRGNQ